MAISEQSKRGTSISHRMTPIKLRSDSSTSLDKVSHLKLVKTGREKPPIIEEGPKGGGGYPLAGPAVEGSGISSYLGAIMVFDLSKNLICRLFLWLGFLGEMSPL